MAIPPTDIRILFANYDIIAYFLNLAFSSEHFISIKHRILGTFNINKKNQSERLYAFKGLLVHNRNFFIPKIIVVFRTDLHKMKINTELLANTLRNVVFSI
jgi:hypothetical protein